MSNKKNDLTSLTQIGQFLHEEDTETEEFFSKLNKKEEVKEESPNEGGDPPPFDSPTPDLPDTPTETLETEEAPNFGSDESTPNFESSEAVNFGEESPRFENSDDSPFEASNDFQTESNDSSEDPFTTTEESPAVTPVEEAPAEELQASSKLSMNEMLEETYEDAKNQQQEEMKAAPVIEEVIKTPAPENFSEVKEFASHLSYGDVSLGGNPPFSIVLKNIRYVEDADDIMVILREHGIAKENNEESFQKSLARGTLLISHISEYSAIYLCHKFRRFNLEVLMGLADDIHPPKVSEETPNKGLINKKGITQNRQDHFKLDHDKIDLGKMIITTTNLIESHEIKRYLGVASEHYVLEANSFQVDSVPTEVKSQSVLSSTLNKIRKVKDLTKDFSLDVQESKPTVKELYDRLTDNIKIQVLKMGGNAMVGVQYQLVHLNGPEHGHFGQYKLTCTGTVVWVSRI